ncbi:MAG: hypothetical protein I8H81_08335 [Pseudomonadales bacterium]|nr:hypothetical protein [Pseudomonadales bacterium]MBH2036409.1 hypothetical protein [Pseudomonadales bacterium]MBH2079681.1 hypothetical protein [Pseudomonadales bacterium]
MTYKSDAVLCRYYYDPLNKTIGSTHLKQLPRQFFYCAKRLTTAFLGEAHHSVFQQDEQLLALQRFGSGTAETILLATDKKRSVLDA